MSLDILDIKERKNILRADLKARRSLIPADKKALYDAAICERISSLPCFMEAESILLYSPIRGEIDLSQVTLTALAMGKRVAYPLCNKNDLSMSFRYVSSPSELVCGSYAIPEPPLDSPCFSFDTKALCIVPALSFDKFGFRLGYGKGYYDRFLKNFKGFSVGAVYSELLCDVLPRGCYDIAVHTIITERRTIIPNATKEQS